MEMYCDTNAESVASGLTIGETYKIRVYTSTATPLQTSTFDVCVGTPPPSPVNDDCANATIAPVNPGEECTTTIEGTISWATASPEPTTCGGTEDDDVWFEFVATATKHRIQTLNVEGSTTSIYHTVYQGDVCGTMTLLYCSTGESSFAEGLTVGETYKVRVYSSTGVLWHTATFDFCITTPPPPPANDECANSIEVPVNAGPECLLTTQGTIYSATESPETTTCSGIEDDDVWFEFVATAVKHRIQIVNIVNGSTPLYHTVYEGDECATLTHLYCSSGISSFAEGLTIGNTYKIRVFSSTGEVNQTSDFEVCVSTPPPPPVNDECTAATVIPVNTGSECIQSVSGTVYSATASTQANACSGTADDDVWFEFTATNATHYISTTITEDSGILYHAVYSGDDCEALTQIDCSTTASNLVEGLTVGETYKVRVYTSVATTNQTIAFDICVGVPAQSIQVDQTTFTTEQLVQNVLFGSPCAHITNITSRTGTNFGETNGIGYFSASTNDFPFQDGVILATTGAIYATNPSGTGGVQTSAWLGDADLEAVISQGGNTDGTNNATVLEFDFMAYTNEFTFDFLFASDEYGSFQCNYSDAFVFLLYDLENPTADPVNLAVIPGTTTPISVVTIRDDAYNPGCDDQNEEYFAQYYTENTYANPIGFNGWTVPLSAVAAVEPGHQYHIKFVIADYRDTSFNSAVFLGGGSFNVGDLDLGADLTIIDETAICQSQQAELSTNLTNTELFDFEWLYDSTPDEGDDTTIPVVIAGADQPTLTVSEPGRYYVRATYGDSDCSLEGDILVEMYEEIAMADPIDLIMCNASGFAEFDMAPNADLILSDIDTTEYNLADFTVTFHESQADAESGDNPVGPVFTNTVADVQPIFARVVYELSGCSTIKEFDLVVQDLTPEFVMPEDFNICTGTTDATITIVPGANFDPTSADVTISWTLNGGPSVSTDVTVPVTGPGIYEVTVNNSGCIAVDSVEVTETAIPVVDDLQDVNACDVYVLPALSANNRYFTGPDATGEELFAGEEITSTVTLYIYAESATVPTNCFAQSDFVVNISPTPVFSLGGPYVSCDVTNLTVMVQEGANFDIATASYAWTVNGTPESGNSQITGTEPGTYTLIVTTAEGCMSAPVSVQVTLDTTVVALNPSQGCDGLQYKVNVEPVGGSYDPDTALISWSGPNGFSSSEASAVVTEAGDYTVTVVTEEGCMGEMTIKVENVACMIPRGISPNDDTLNDNFDLTGFDVTKLSIFNRYGREVYSKTDYTDEWHGQTDGGEELPTGTYFYSVEFLNGESKTGWVYINRQEN